jgi:hypothetical protein
LGDIKNEKVFQKKKKPKTEEGRGVVGKKDEMRGTEMEAKKSTGEKMRR